MKLGEILNHHPDKLVYQPDPSSWVAPSLRIGVEIETENPSAKACDKNSLSPYWTVGEDGSLRDHGHELTLEKPLFGVDLKNALDSAETYFKKNSHLVFNYRTGLHIHLDSRELELAELQRMFVLYALFEKSMFNFVGDQRNSNNFCAPWGRISDHLDKIFTIFDKSLSKEDIGMTLRNVERYSALNCQALYKFGSVEFRHMQMSHNFEKIKEWINIIMSIYAVSKEGASYGPQIPTQDFIRLAAKGGAEEIARRIFPKSFLKFVDDKAIWEGILLAQDISLDIEQGQTKFLKHSLIKGICPHPGQSAGYLLFVNRA